MGPYTDLIDYDSAYSLANALDDAESDFRGDFIDYWGLEGHEPPEGMDRDEWLELRKLYGLAEQIGEVASTLIKRKGLGPQRLAQPAVMAAEARDFQAQVDKVLDAIKERFGLDTWAAFDSALLPHDASDPRTKQSVFQTSLELFTSALFIPSLDAVVARLQRLVDYLVAAQNERSNAFLARVARCYCLDHRTELAVMCRAVLDTALQDIAPDEHVRAHLGGRTNERIGLAKRLDYVDSLGTIGSPVRAAMDRLKRVGDDAVHTAPGLEPDPDELMSDLVDALHAITVHKGTMDR